MKKVVYLLLISTLFISCNKKTNETIKSSFIDSNSINEKNLETSDDSIFAFTEEIPESELTFELTDNFEGVIIKSYRGKGTHLRIPSEIQGYPVVEIDNYVFFQRNIESIFIPDSIKRIGSSVFFNCKLLKNVRLPNSLTTISESLFRDCDSLIKISIPASVSIIEQYAFSNSGLISLTIPDTVVSSVPGTQGHYKSFLSDCKNLETVKLPSSMKKIPNHVFKGCQNLNTIEFADDITEIGSYAFSGCTSLTWINIPSSVTKIGKGAFNNVGLTVLNIPDSVTELECSFHECQSLKKLHLPNSLTEISNNLFHGEYSHSNALTTLETVNLPSSIKVIDYDAFYNLTNLSEIQIPDNITDIEWKENYNESSAFRYCPNINLVTQKKLRQMGYKGKFN